MADIRSTPVANRPAYYLAGLLDTVNEAVSKPFGFENDPVRMATNLLGIPELVQTLQNTAYGMPNTRGSGMATQLRPEAKVAVGNLLPAAPAAARVAVKGATSAAKYAAPKVGQMAEQYAVKTGLLNPMIAWHGSPHSFDTFDIKKVGMGEGAQAYGHGMYFAESPKVAGEYAAANQGRAAAKLGEIDGLPKPFQMEAFKILEMKDSPFKQAALDDLNSRLVVQGHPPIAGRGGNLYKVDIPDPAVATFLDWDKPLSQQPELVRQNLERIGLRGDQTGADAYKKLSGFDAKVNVARVTISGGFDPVAALKRAYPNINDAEIAKTIAAAKRGSGDAVASSILNDAGIQGIRYLDGGSRGTGAGTSNFVVFDPSIVKILERNGQPVGLLEGGKKIASDAKIEFKPDSSFLSASNEYGLVGGHIKGDTLRITTAEVDAASRGKGIGVGLYQKLIDDALSKGLKVTSDFTVEAPAVRVYESLKKRGYDVRRLDGGTLEDGAVYGKNASAPAFEIVGKNSKPKGLLQIPKTSHELAHEVAQKNAVEMLGLPPGNTAMDRARALGYDQPVYRGTTANETKHGGNVWVTDTPEAANYYAGHVVQDELYPMLQRHEGGNVMPLVGHRDMVHADNADVLWNGGSRWQVPAESLRSRFAAFDPARINEPDLLAAGIPLGLIAGTEVEIPKPKKAKK